MADASYSDIDAHRPDGYDAAPPQQYDAQPRPECRIDFECPEPLKCLEQRCRSDKDTDFDMILDDVDNCKFVPNPQQEDTDRDGIGNDCDTDEGNDGRIDCEQGFLYAQNRMSDLGDFDIYFFNETHRTVTRIIQREGKADIEPAWSPDGVWFAYASDLYGNFDIFVSLLHGRNSQQLTRNDSNEHHPTFSPDGEWIAYSSDRTGDTHIYRIKREGIEEECLTCQFDAQFQEPVYEDDYTIIVTYKKRGEQFFEVGDLTILNNNNKRLQNITAGSITRFYDARSPALNPEFKRNYVFSAISETGIRSIYRCIHDPGHNCNSAYKVYVQEQEEASEPAWSGDGTDIYYVTKTEGGKRVWRREDIIWGRNNVAEGGYGHTEGSDQINPAPSQPCNQ